MVTNKRFAGGSSFLQAPAKLGVDDGEGHPVVTAWDLFPCEVIFQARARNEVFARLKVVL